MTVDILFPFYGDVAMMKEAVRSVLRQTKSGLAVDRRR